MQFILWGPWMCVANENPSNYGDIWQHNDNLVVWQGKKQPEDGVKSVLQKEDA